MMDSSSSLIYSLFNDPSVLSDKIARATLAISASKTDHRPIIDFAIWALAEVKKRSEKAYLYPDADTTKEVLAGYLQLAMSITQSMVIRDALKRNLALFPDSQSGATLATMVDLGKFDLGIFEINASKCVQAGLLYAALKTAWNPRSDTSFVNLKEALNRYLHPVVGGLRVTTENLISSRPSFYSQILIDAVGLERACDYSTSVAIISGKSSGDYHQVRKAFEFVVSHSDTYSETWIYEIPRQTLSQIIIEMSKDLAMRRWSDSSHVSGYTRISPTFNGLAAILDHRKDVVNDLSENSDFATFCGLCLVEYEHQRVNDSDLNRLHERLGRFGESFLDLCRIIFAMNRVNS